MAFRTKFLGVPAFVLLVGAAGGAAVLAACVAEPDPGLNPQPLPPGAPPDQSKSPNEEPPVAGEDESTSSSSGFGGSSSSSGGGMTPSSDGGLADAKDAQSD